MGHLLQIPPEGLIHLFHSDAVVERETIDNILVASVIDPAHIEVKYDEQDCSLYFVPDPDRPVNERARSLVADLFGWHMIFYGDVVIEDLTEDQIVEVMRKVSSGSGADSQSEE